MRLSLARLGIAVAVSGLFAASAHALPGTVRTDHPRLYASLDDLRRLVKQLPLLNQTLPEETSATDRVFFPGKRGRVSFTFKPTRRTGTDELKAGIFGSRGVNKDGIYLHYFSSDERNAVLDVGAVLRDPKGESAAGSTGTQITIPLDVETVIEVQWDADLGKIAISTSGAQVWEGKLPGTFNANEQPFLFGGRRGDRMPVFRIYNESDKLIRQFAANGSTPADSSPVDLELGAAWQKLLALARARATDFALCAKEIAPQKCEVTKGGRVQNIGPAKMLALAYRLSGERTFLDAALNHINLIYAVNEGVMIESAKTHAGTGGEWSMSARVGAMGVYYDWLYGALSVPQKQVLREAITKTVTFNNAGHDDLRYSICGNAEMSGMACAEGWETQDGPNSISRNYITGHTQSAQFGTVLGLLAIENEQNDVNDLISTIYRHFETGYLPARAAVSYPTISDEALMAQPWLKNSSRGGHQTLFAYNSASIGELPERLLVWQRALTLGGSAAGLQAPWLPSMISPYLYGLRGDGKFPASGDNFDYALNDSELASLALTAAQEGNATAYGFYQKEIVARRPMHHSRVLWERLLYPVPATQAAQSPDELPLSVHYPVAGNVLMRNSWVYPDAALLDFKSASFISENHHHLDQNSFSLFYKAPLLVDSGQYDEYQTVHWKNYYERTIAHNSIVLFDPAEKFTYTNNEVWSNDGGQWFDERKTYPTVEEIGGDNKLDGVTAYEEGGWYAYTEGNATKAYKRDKLNDKAGFLRSVIYLRPEGRPNDPDAKATVVVFDKVRTAAGKALAATSLLHMTGRPVASGEPIGKEGRYTYPFGSDQSTFTIRKDGGMATIQALLPKSGKATLVGGLNYKGSTDTEYTCKQAGLKDKILTVTGTSGDCRYLVQGSVAGVFGWYNYTPANLTNINSDNGQWRLEFSPATTPVAGAAQYFLNVIRAADSDMAAGPVTLRDEQKAVLVDTGYETVGVQIGSDRRIIFNGGTQQNMWPVWQPGSFQGTTLVVGLLPNSCYSLVDHEGKKALKPSVGCTYKSSAAGVVTIR
ncbi:heparinase II/III family protein [Pseudoduganella plicata]|uniref:Heparinase II/III-like C-terminal domain-containing protein n=1 Tax=Pseudoduganella plicata TaxID=321984 RepID=A0A4P7BJF4_9BURK|nr:heparinase II/III family protein [Pseudoduganella plicata]QBQ39041.1 hypothetical protein E1742_25010 [Pseudoduganella plicata]GGY86724.1 hypothetical protein GCM10007388_20010 [Pseudoduganella plicata]